MSDEFDSDENEDEIFSPAGVRAAAQSVMHSRPLVGATPQAAADSVLQLSPSDATDVWICTDAIEIRVRVRKFAQNDDSIGLILDNQQCDIVPVASTRYTVRHGDLVLRTMYVGGKVDFGAFTLLSFILVNDES